jgi:hypothetical protein
MPKLNTTIDNLELKSNKVIDRIPSADWTDAQYPSAKALYHAYSQSVDIAHPVGSLMITTTNTNPATTVGGTWVLIDKSFKAANIDLTLTPAAYWTALNATLGPCSSVLLADHTLSLRLNLFVTANLTDSTDTLGTLNSTTLGVTELVPETLSNVAISDGGGSILAYELSQNGELSVTKVWLLDETSAADGNQSYYINLSQSIPHTKMLDEFCDKFYWKRTA